MNKTNVSTCERIKKLDTEFEQAKKDGKKTVIWVVGFAPSKTKVEWTVPEGEHHEYWGLNELYMEYPIDKYGWTRWFELHDIFARTEISPRNKKHLETMQGWELPVYMWEQTDKIKSSVKFPLHELSKKYGYYWTNSISYMIALALDMKPDVINVYGVDMSQDTEYEAQRPSCEYYIGMAKGMGIEVNIPLDSDLLKSSEIYGYHTDNALRVKLNARQQELTKRLNQHQGLHTQALSAVNQLTGRINELTELMKQLDNGEKAPVDREKLVETGKKRLNDFKVELGKAQKGVRDNEAAINQIRGAQENCKYISRVWSQNVPST